MKRFAYAAALIVALSACQSSEERADKHYSSAVELIAAGDMDRGLVELRNVFKLNGTHRDARALYARTVRARGDTREAFAQYLRLAEQYPQDVEAAQALAELSLIGPQPQSALRYAKVLREQGVNTPEAQAILIAADYADASARRDRDAMAEAGRQATALLQAESGLSTARRVTVAEALAVQDMGLARREIEAGIAALVAVNPDSTAAPTGEREMLLRQFGQLHLAVLQQLGDKPGMEAALKQMIVLFPADKSFQSLLVRWYVSEGRLDDGEAWLRSRVAQADTDPEPRSSLVQFLAQLRGPEAALAEMDASLAAEPRPADVAANLAVFRGQRAGFIYTLRDPQEAIGELRAILAAGESDGTSADQIDTLRITLARMEDGQGNRVGARQMVETVLGRDASNLEALKLKGNWLVDDDQTGDALITLRAALDAAPRDSEAMMMMARAYEREGNRDLMGDALARAVEASNNGPRESLLYAQFLVADQKLRTAETVLIDALKLAPDNVQILAQLGRVHVLMKDWPRAEQDIAQLRQLDPEQTAAVADELQARVFAGQNRIDDLTAFLDQRPNAGNRISADSAVIRANLLAGRIDEALERSRLLLEAMPEDPAAQFVRATVLALSGQDEAAEPLMEQVVAAQPRTVEGWTTLTAIALRRDDATGAMAVLDRAAAALPDSPQIKLARAGLLERQADLEGAIGIYEALYEQDSGQVVIANNLASLLSTAREDEASLERAHVISRRLRGIPAPAMQDTYGWIAFRRGDLQEARASLEPAAAGLPGDPQAQYHLGRLKAAIGDKGAAQAQYDKALQLIGQTSNPVLAERIRTAVAALETGQDPAAGAVPKVVQ